MAFVHKEKQMSNVFQNQLIHAARRMRKVLSHPNHERDSMASALRAFSGLSSAPGTVFDVGAALGTPDLYQAFPVSEFLLIEPLSEFHAELTQVAEHLKSARVVPCAVGSSPGTETFHVHPDLVGSSFHMEPEDDESVNGVGRRIEVKTLDMLATTFDLQPPFFIKIDTQGHESEVLKGATEVLSETTGVVLELSLFNFFADAPNFACVIQQMAEKGFVIYDVFDRQYRLLDGALGQFDALFVPEQSNIRGSHRYASDEQRRSQTARIRRTFRGTRLSNGPIAQNLVGDEA